MKTVYLDNAASTPVLPEVFEAMKPYLTGVCGNPSSRHPFGRAEREAIEKSRQKIAEILNCAPDEIYFTSGGTESANWAIKGAARSGKGRHIVTTAIEHPAVLNSCKALEVEGFDVTYIKPNNSGAVDAEKVISGIRSDTALVSVMYANNETGVIQPVRSIAAACRERGVPFFTDATQAAGSLPIDLKTLGADMLSLSGHKFHAPKGIGLLYIKNGTKICNLIDGGGQERGRRSGTENTAFAVGLCKALELSAKESYMTENERKLRDKLINGVLSAVPDSRLNGDGERLPGIANFSFKGVESEGLLLLLEASGIYASAGSACSFGQRKPSRVLAAMDVPDEYIFGSVRFSLCRYTTEEEIGRALAVLPGAVARLRGL